MCIQDAVTIYPADGTTEPPTSSQYYSYHKNIEGTNADASTDQATSAPQKADQPGAWWTNSSLPSRISSRIPASESIGSALPANALPPMRQNSPPTALRHELSAPPGTLSSRKTGLASTATETTMPRAKPAPPNRNLNQIVTYSCTFPMR